MKISFGSSWMISSDGQEGVMINQRDTAVGCSESHIGKSICKKCEDKAVVLLLGSELLISCCQD